MHGAYFILLAVSLCLTLSGCEVKTTTTNAHSSGVGQAGSEPAPAAAAVNLQVVDEKEFAAVVAKHKGKVVLVDFWATWCGPCVEAFPHTVEMHKKHHKRGLAAISLSFDDPDDQVKVRTFLESQGATFDNLLSKYGTALVDAATAFDFEGSLPHYRLYDRTGKLRHSWSPESAKPAELEQKIEELLAEK